MCHAGLWRPGRRAFSGCCAEVCMGLSGGCEVARCLCVRNDGGEETGRKQGRKDIVVIMKFARKQRKHIYPLPVVYHPSPLFFFSMSCLPTCLPLTAFRAADKQEE